MCLVDLAVQLLAVKSVCESLLYSIKPALLI